MDLGNWADIATIATAVVAAVAIYQARHLQNEAAQPYVVVSLETHEHLPELIELVVKNHGNTSATDVRLEVSPAPVRVARRGGNATELLRVPSVWPTMAPGQEWRSIWDLTRDRWDAEVPREYTVDVSYQGIGRGRIEHTFVLDWTPFLFHQYVKVSTIHDVAKSLKRLERGIKLEGPVHVRRDKEMSRREARRRRRAERKFLELMKEQETELPPGI